MNDRLQSLFAYLADRLKEASTWRGLIVAIATALGYTLDEPHILAYITLGVFVAGCIGVMFPDKVKE